MSRPALQHAPMEQFTIKENCLCVGNTKVTDLAEQIGSTPFYAYDRSIMTKQVEQLRALLPSQIHLHYAMKANPMPDVVNHMASLVDGIDIASKGELKVALATGAPVKDISFAGPGKTDEELKAAVKAGITVNLESENELARINRIGLEAGIQPIVAIRVNPDFELKTSGMKMGGGPKQFGIDAERLPETLKSVGQMDIKFRGFHIFSGSQNLRPEAIIEAHDKTFELAIRLAADAPNEIDLLNIGGGLGIPYFPGEQRLKLQPIVDNLNRLMPTVTKALPRAELVMELGRYLVGEAGIYICKIIDKKISRGHTFLITDGGLHHHLSASGNFGQIIRKNYPVDIANRINQKSTELVSIVGPLCTPLDLIADKMELPTAEVGDLVVVFQSGAYGYTASPLGFLSHPAPMEVLI